MTEFLELARQRYRQRDELLRQLPAQRLVACLGLDIPDELLLATGLQPVRLEFNVQQAGASAQRFGDGGHPVLRSLVGELLGGRYAHINRLIIGTTPRYLAALYTFIAELRQREAEFRRFEVRLLDVARGDSASSLHYGAESLAALHEQVQQWSGKPIGDQALRAAIAQQNRVRSLLLRFNQRRVDHSGISGELALQVHACAALPDRDAFLDALEHWLAPAPDATMRAAHGPTTSRPRIIYSGTATGDDTVYRGIEAAGLRIVDDDQDTGARAVGPLVDETMASLPALLAHLHQRHPSAAGWSSQLRAQYLLERTRAARADGVLFVGAAYDHPAGWDYPALRAALDQSGVPHASVDPYYYRDPSLLQRAATEFAAALRARQPAATA